MRRTLPIVCATLLLSLAVLSHTNKAAASSYGLYGVVRYPGNGVVANATVTIYKQMNGQYVYQGQTVASACGYYTYDTGGTGNYRVVVHRNYYSLRYASCGSIFANESVAGDVFVTIWWWNPQTQVDVNTA